MAKRRKTHAQKTVSGTRASPSNITSPRYVIYASLDGRISNVTVWATIWAAKRTIDLMLDGRDIEWLSNTKLITEDGKLELKSEELEDIIEYDYANDEEAEWMPTQELPSIFKAAGKVYEIPEGVPIEKPKRKERSSSKPRVSRDGLVSAGDIATELGVSPREVRGVLRSLKLKKPDVGWAWPSAEAEKIKSQVKKGLK